MMKAVNEASRFVLSHAVTLLLLCASHTLLAQPDAGSALRDLQVPVLTIPADGGPILTLPAQPAHEALPADIRMTVAGFTLVGNTVIDDATLQSLLADLTGRELTLEELYSAADRVTAAYRERGYLLSRGLLPAQEIADKGQVRVQVLEGRYGVVALENSSLVSDASLSGYLNAVMSGALVEANTLEQKLLLLDDLPGITVQTRLSAGAAQGETDLTVVAASEERISGLVSLDNQGNRNTGEYRLNTRLSVASPFGRGDAFGANVLYSDEDQLFYQARYDMPLGQRGTGFGLSSSRMQYELAGDFVDLAADGTADTLGLSLRQVWLRSRNLNLRSDILLERRDLEDSVSNGQVVTRKQADDLSLGFSGDWRDSFGGGGLSVFSLRWVHGDVSLKEGQFPPATPRGDFDKWQLSWLRLQSMGEHFTLYLGMQAQLTDSNLDSSEKMMLGGNQGVRAYPLGEASADEAVLANLELRYRLNSNWQLRALFDGGYARLLNDSTGPDDNYHNLSSVGLGLDWQAQSGLQFSLSASTRTGEAPRSDRDENLRVWGQLQWQF